MNWLKQNWVLVLLLVVGGIATWSVLSSRVLRAKVKEAEQQAAVHVALSDSLLTTARENARHAQIEEAKVQEGKVKLASSEKSRVALAKRVAMLEAGLAPVPVGPVPGDPVDPDERDAWRRAVQSRDDLIVAMKAERAQVEVVLADKDKLLASMERAMLNYKEAYQGAVGSREELEKANAQLRLALEAQKGVTRAERMKWFLIGAAAGGAGGALAAGGI